MQDESERGIKVKMLFFGPLAERLGKREIEVVLLLGTTCSELIERFNFTSFVENGVAVAIDGEIIKDLNIELSDAGEIAFLPPVSGG